MIGLPKARKKRTRKTEAPRFRSRRNLRNMCNVFPERPACRDCIYSTNPELFDGLCLNPARWDYIRGQIAQEQHRTA